jgi:hypothetical protein
MLKYLKKNFVIYFFFLLIFFIILSITINGWLVSWNYLRITSALPPHFDLRFYQYPAISIERGLNPLFATGEFWAKGLPENWQGHSKYYLPAFKLSHFLNLYKETNFILFANFIIINFIYVIYKLIKIKKNSFWIVILFFSGSTLLAIERTNNDLIIFCLLYWAAIFPNIIGSIFIIVATYIEFWPMAAGIAYIKKKIKILLFFSLIIFLLYFYKYMFSESSIVIINDWLSFGSKSTSITIERYFFIKINHIYISIFLILISFLTLIKKINLLNSEFKKKPNDLYERLFLIGSTLYCGLFILQSNYDYKLILVIFCVPYISSLKNKFDKYISLISIVISSNLNILINNKIWTGKGIDVLLNVISKNVLFVILLSLLLKYLINYYKSYGFKKFFI